MKPVAEQSLETLRQALHPLVAECVVRGRMVEVRVHHMSVRDGPDIEPYVVLLPLSKLENMRGISQVVLEARQHLSVSMARSRQHTASND